MSTVTEEIKVRLSVVDIVGEYVRLQKAGSNFKGLCPFHNEKSPSFSVNEERAMWHCFGCGKSGDIFTFLMEREGLSFPEALRLLADKAGVEVPKGPNRTTEGNRDRSLEILEAATTFYEGLFARDDCPARTYVSARGISDDMARAFRLGYAPNAWDGVQNELLRREYRLDEIEKAGLLVRKDTASGARVSSHYDRFRDRVMFPVCDVLGRVVGFSARVLPGADEKSAKYINTPETDVYHKSRALYGISQAKAGIRRENAVIIVEGNMDVIALHQAGFDNAVAVSGTALTSSHLDILRRLTDRVILFFDMDPAGQEAAKKSAVLGFQYDMDVSIVSLAHGKDAAELAKDDPGALADAIANARVAMEYFLSRILESHDRKDSSGKKAIARESLALIDALRNDVEKDTWLRRLADDLDVGVQALLGVLSQTRSAAAPWQKSGPSSRDLVEPTLLTRSDALIEKAVGLMLAVPDVWKHAITALSAQDRAEVREFFSQDSLAHLVFDKAEEVSYNFETFRFSLRDDNMRSRAERLHYQNLIGESQTDSFENPDIEDALRRFDTVFSQMDTELLKRQLHRIVADMKRAEASGDKQAVALLSREFSELSRRMNPPEES